MVLNLPRTCWFRRFKLCTAYTTPLAGWKRKPEHSNSPFSGSNYFSTRWLNARPKIIRTLPFCLGSMFEVMRTCRLGLCGKLSFLQFGLSYLVFCSLCVTFLISCNATKSVFFSSHTQITILPTCIPLSNQTVIQHVESQNNLDVNLSDD